MQRLCGETECCLQQEIEHVTLIPIPLPPFIFVKH